MGHLHTFKKPKKNATNPAITISQRNTISNNVLLLLYTAMPAKLTQLEGCCCKIQQCSVLPSYNALLQKQHFAPIHHHIMLCFTICCTTIHCFVAPPYNTPYYTPLQCSFASIATYNSLLHPYKMHCCTLLQCSVAPYHTNPCCPIILCPVALWYNDLFYTIIQCIVVPSYNAVLHHHSILCCTISQCSVAQTTMLCCTFIRCSVASSYNSLLHHHIAVFHLVHHHTMLGCNVIHCLFLFHPSLICYNNIQCSNAHVLWNLPLKKQHCCDTAAYCLMKG